MKKWVSAKSTATVAVTSGFSGVIEFSRPDSSDGSFVYHHNKDKDGKKAKFANMDPDSIPDPTSIPLPAEDRQEKIMWAYEKKAALEKEMDGLMEGIGALLVKEKEEMDIMDRLERYMKERMEGKGKGNGKEVDRK